MTGAVVMTGKTIPSFRAPVLAVLAASMLLGGCFLDRSPVRSIGQLDAYEYCPGDTLTASYDLLGDLPGCPADVDCTTYLPRVDIESTPASFPPASFNAYRGEVAFVPAGDEVTVEFRIDRSAVVIPTDEFREGSRVFVQRDLDETTSTRTAHRIDGITTEQVYNGMCAGANPVYATADLRDDARSPNLGLEQLCNTSGVPIELTLHGEDGSVEFMPLSPGQCFMPGSDMLGVVAARAQFPDPSARCGAVDGNQPPRPLTTTARLVCR